MKFSAYRPLAMRTAKRIDPDMDTMHILMGVMGEGGELIDAYKKHLIYGKELDKVNVLEEAGDLCWFLNFFMVIGEAPDDFLDTVYEGAQEYKGQHGVLVPKQAITNLMGTIGQFCNTDSDPDARIFAIIPTMIFALDCLLADCGYTMAQALERNIDKLAARYGDKYSDLAAIKRDLALERATLEAQTATLQ